MRVYGRARPASTPPRSRPFPRSTSSSATPRASTPWAPSSFWARSSRSFAKLSKRSYAAWRKRHCVSLSTTKNYRSVHDLSLEDPALYARLAKMDRAKVFYFLTVPAERRAAVLAPPLESCGVDEMKYAQFVDHVNGVLGRQKPVPTDAQRTAKLPAQLRTLVAVLERAATLPVEVLETIRPQLLPVLQLVCPAADAVLKRFEPARPEESSAPSDPVQTPIPSPPHRLPASPRRRPPFSVPRPTAPPSPPTAASPPPIVAPPEPSPAVSHPLPEPAAPVPMTSPPPPATFEPPPTPIDSPIAPPPSSAQGLVSTEKPVRETAKPPLPSRTVRKKPQAKE